MFDPRGRPLLTIRTDRPLAVAVVEAIQRGDVAALKRMLRENPALATARLGDDDRRREHCDVRDATLDTAAALVAEHGLLSVTMSQIAEETGIGRATLKHLNRKHADTVLFLARHAAGVSDAVDVELLAVDRDGLDIAVRQALGSTARLQFTAAINAAPDLRLQLRGLLGRARAAAPDEPLTSLEEEIASRGGKARRAHEG